MLNYLCCDSVFENLSPLCPATDMTTRRRILGVRNTFTLRIVRPFYTVAFQRSFLHREARVAGVEFLDVLCDQLEELSKTRHSYGKLNSLRFKFGQKFVREDGRIFWATDSQYTLACGTRCHRRDFLHSQGVLHGNALCCETICFVEVTNARAVGSRVDTLNLVIVRWLDTHPRACERDDLGRPLCPGPLSINNCLWTYARSATPRRSMVQPCGAASRSFNIYRQMFGATGTEQRECWTREKHAYFGFVTPDNIHDTMHMCHTFESGSAKPDLNTWLQTVRMC